MAYIPENAEYSLLSFKKIASKNSLSFSRYFNFTKVKDRFERTVFLLQTYISSSGVSKGRGEQVPPLLVERRFLKIPTHKGPYDFGGKISLF